MEETTVALRMQSVSKRFPGTLAVNKVDFEVKAGEVHALMGENGAGKSTLMKILAGSFSDYTGDIFINGKAVSLRSPSMAKAEGIAMIYQELSIAYNRSVSENILAGALPGKGLFVDQKAVRESALRSLARVKLDGRIDPDVQMKNISQHEAQLIEIAKALDSNPEIIVMDEPTSALSRDEVEILFDIIREIKQSGMAVIYISHHLPEVFEVADRVTVMRDGEKIASCNVADVTKEQLVEMMVGQKISDFYKKKNSKIGDVVLEVNDLTRYGFVHNASLKLHRGEILGLSGLAGAGRSELARCLVGVDPIDHVEYLLEGKPVKVKDMNQMVDLGVGYLSENRKTEGLSLRLTNRENTLAAIIGKLSSGGFYFPSRGNALVQELFEDLQIHPSDPEITVGNLSGGNQQKVLLAKWLATKPKVLILDEPTRGVDVGAKKTIHETIVRLVEEGVSVILISSDLPELVSLSDRVIVMQQGHLIGEMAGGTFDENAVLLAANGERSVLTLEY